jgi:copper oxidase (laccase) domain-containing protein
VVEQEGSMPEEIPAGLRVAGVRQIHGSEVVNVGTTGGRSHPGGSGLPQGDAALASDEETCVSVLVADCLPIAIGSPEGVRVAVHAGWRGLVAGIVKTAAAAAREAGATSLVAGLGPCIGPCCYEFSPVDLERVTHVLGSRAATKTTSGSDALDIRTAAHDALDAAGVRVEAEDVSCTSCGSGWYSARARADTERQALYVWRVR